MAKGKSLPHTLESRTRWPVSSTHVPLHVAEGRAKQRAILAAELDKEGSGFKSAKSASQRKNAKKIMFAH